MRKIYETAVILAGTIGWWGFVYPDMCLTEDVYEQEYEEDLEQTDASKPLDFGKHTAGAGEACTDGAVKGADGAHPGWKVGNIRIKSRILEYVYQERE